MEIQPARQAANVVMQLGGAARELVRHMSYDQITHRALLLGHLASNDAPLGEECRLTAMTELMQCRRNPGESTDSLLARYQGITFRAETGGAGMTMSFGGYSWLLLRACGVSQGQLITLLQPTNSRFPTTEAEYSALTMAIRRIAHVLEGSFGKIASQLRSAPSAFPAFSANEIDPWSPG